MKTAMQGVRLLDVRTNFLAISELAARLSERRGLLAEMTRRELADRYAGQFLGAGWAVLTPVLTMATYVLAFGLIFRGRIGPLDDGWAYVAYMLAGLVPWLMVQESLSRAPTAISANASLVKQIVFPSEILPMKVTLAVIPALLVCLTVAIGVSLLAGTTHALGLLVLLPLACACLILLLAGFAYMLAAVGVFARDIKDVVSFALSIGVLLHPVLYPPASVPGWLQPLFHLSPFSHMIWCFRDALIVQNAPHYVSWVVFPLVSAVTFALGWRVFRTLKPTFGNAL